MKSKISLTEDEEKFLTMKTISSSSRSTLLCCAIERFRFFSPLAITTAFGAQSFQVLNSPHEIYHSSETKAAHILGLRES